MGRFVTNTLWKHFWRIPFDISRAFILQKVSVVVAPLNFLSVHFGVKSDNSRLTDRQFMFTFFSTLTQPFIPMWLFYGRKFAIRTVRERKKWTITRRRQRIKWKRICESEKWKIVRRKNIGSAMLIAHCNCG